ITQLVCQTALVASSTSGWSETTRTYRRSRTRTAGPAAQAMPSSLAASRRLHFHSGLALRRIERLLVAVDPDHGDALLDARGNIGVVGGRNVDPTLLCAQA